jgi:RsiW-degrading membrane proteinase PrsW (M82 family)
VPWLWRILPSGIPGLAFSIVLASLTTALVGQFLGVNKDFAEWAFVLLPLPMLLISILTMFGRFGRTEDEERPIKKVVWLYRVGGVVMLLLTLRLVGII